MYYRTCKLCGANLDPEETCDCWLETESEDKPLRRRRMKEEVTKTELVQKLAELLRMTRLDIENLELLDKNTVMIHYECGSTKAVDITADSGIAIIRDVCRHVID